MELETFPADQIKFKHPFRCLVSGGSGTGKTFTVFKLIKFRNQMIDSERPLKVLFYLPHGHKIKVPQEIQNDKDVEFKNGSPDFESIYSPTLVVIDDMMTKLDDNIVQAFIRYSNHKSISVVLLVQNIFYNSGKSLLRNISLNCTHFIITKSIRDRRQITTLASQMKPGNSRFITESYDDATQEPYTYFLCDLTQTQNEKLRYRTRIFPDDPFPRNIIYVEK
jgi:hypothetical protein